MKKKQKDTKKRPFWKKTFVNYQKDRNPRP